MSDSQDGGGESADRSPERSPDRSQEWPADRVVDRVVDRADYDPTYDPNAPVLCELCDGEMHYTAACKLKCPRCGYMRDCSDP